MSYEIYKIEAIIRPNRLEAVQEALRDIEIQSITVVEARGVGKRKSLSHTFRGSQYSNNLAPITKVELFVLEDVVKSAVEVIQEAAFTGEAGDGKVFVIPVSDALRIRTGEKGPTALS